MEQAEVLEGWCHTGYHEPPMSPFLQHVATHMGPPFRAWLRLQVRGRLEGRRRDWAELQREQQALREHLGRVETMIDTEYQRLDRSPLQPDTTVHAAHRRHPSVQAVFARYGLPHCPDCAVGADESLEEAAFGEGFSLTGLLGELNALLLAPGYETGRRSE